MQKYLDQFLSYLRVERGLAENTIKACKIDLAKYLKFLKKREIISLGNSQRPEITNYLLGLKKPRRPESPAGEKDYPPYPAPYLCHAPSAGRSRSKIGPGDARTQRHLHYPDLYPCGPEKAEEHPRQIPSPGIILAYSAHREPDQGLQMVPQNGLQKLDGRLKMWYLNIMISEIQIKEG